MRISHPKPAPYMGRCNYCGLNWGATHSGSYECTACWDYRKLDRPAASHWRRVLLPVFSNIDMNDIIHFFPDSGTTADSLAEVRKVLIRSLLLLQHGPTHRWDRETLRMIWDAENDNELLDNLLTDADKAILQEAC